MNCKHGITLVNKKTGIERCAECNAILSATCGDQRRIYTRYQDTAWYTCELRFGHEGPHEGQGQTWVNSETRTPSQSDFESLRVCLHQYNRAMGELSWTMANVNTLGTLERIETAYLQLEEIRRAAQALQDLKDGPRDEAYEAAKEPAWDALRNELARLKEIG